MSDEIVKVNMGLRKHTIQQVRDLVRQFKVENRTDAVVEAVRLAHSILEEMENGGRVELHRRNGEVRELVV